MSVEREIILRTWAWRLGPAGLLPFVGLAFGSWVAGGDLLPGLVRAQLGYAAVILSFVGALHWGAALVSSEVPGRVLPLVLGWSVVPALAGWIALLIGPQPGLLLLVVALVTALLVDWLLYRHYAIAAWFLRLRLLLTAIAALSLLATHLALPA